MSAQRTPARNDARRGAQLAKIHIAKKWAVETLGMTGGDYRALVGDVMSEVGDLLPPGEKPSARFLSDLGRTTLLARFRGLGWPDPKGERHDRPAEPRGPARRKGRTNGRYPVSGARGMIVQAQADYLAHLEDLADWTDDPKRLIGFIERQTGKLTMVAALSRSEATVILTGLEYVVGIKNPKTKNQHARWGKVAEEERERARARRQRGAGA